MRVLVLTPYRFDTVPGQRYRIEQWIPYLERLGVEVRCDAFASPALQDALYRPGAAQVVRKAAFMAHDYLRRVVRSPWRGRFDAILLYREASLIGPAWIERRIASCGLPVVYDFDDAIFLPPPVSSNGVFSRLKFPAKTATICGLSDHVVVGNRFLADFARRYNPHVTVIPTTIDLERYSSKKIHAPSAAPVIGWTGSHTSLRYLETLRPALVELSRRRPFRLRVIGVPGFALGPVPVDVVPWRSATEASDLLPIDVGVMPLPDDEWTRGKCACKALQYMALGIPAVASPVGMNGDLIQDGVNGFLAATTEEWVTKLAALLDDVEVRRRLGDAGLRTVEAGYSAGVQAPRLREIFESVTRRDVSGSRRRRTRSRTGP